MRHQQQEQKEAVKQKIFSQLKDEDLEVISLTGNPNMYWEEEGKEFILNGAIYDVVKIKIINSKVILYCINDKKEKALIDNYNLLTKQNSSSDKKGKTTNNYSINLFVYTTNGKNEEYFTDVLNNFPSFVSPLRESFVDKIPPPPKA